MAMIWICCLHRLEHSIPVPQQAVILWEAMECLGGGIQLAKIGVYGQDFESYSQAFDAVCSLLPGTTYSPHQEVHLASLILNLVHFKSFLRRMSDYAHLNHINRDGLEPYPFAVLVEEVHKTYKAHKPPHLRFCEQCPTASEKRLPCGSPLQVPQGSPMMLFLWVFV